VSGRPRRNGGTQFRKCRKPIPAEAREAGRRRHLRQLRGQVRQELQPL
jgi:hypothetical protein